MKEKINKWIEVHWKIVLVLIIVIAPIGIYFLSLQYSIGTKKELSADYIFSGLVTYVGVIISIGGIYWQVTRTERKEKKIKEEELNEKISGLAEIYEEKIYKNVKKFINSRDGNSIDDLKKNLFHYFSLIFDDNKIEEEWFFVVNEKIFMDNSSIILRTKKLKILYKFNSEMESFNKLLNVLRKKKILNSLLADIQELTKKYIDDENFFKFLKNEINIIKLLCVKDKLGNATIHLLVEENLKLLESINIADKDLITKYKGFYVALELYYTDFNSESIKAKLRERMLFVTALLLRKNQNNNNKSLSVEIDNTKEKIILYGYDVFEFLELVEEISDEFKKMLFIIQESKKEDS